MENQRLVSKLEYFVTFFFFGYILFIILVNVVNVGLMNYHKRKHDISAYRSIGASRKQIQAIFIWESLQGILAVIPLSIVLGLIVSYGAYYLLQASMSHITHHFTFNPWILILCFGFGIVIVCVESFAIYMESRKQDIIADLRYNP